MEEASKARRETKATARDQPALPKLKNKMKEANAWAWFIGFFMEEENEQVNEQGRMTCEWGTMGGALL